MCRPLETPFETREIASSPPGESEMAQGGGISRDREGGEGAPRVPFVKTTLGNGLQLILHVDRRLPVVHVNQWYHVGSKNERPGRTGFAHLFEHLMFEGSLNAKGEYFDHVERIGANLREGGVNGTTSQDRTNYFVTAPSGALEYLLWLESDRLATLMDAMDPSKLDNQRDVVRNERRQSYENRPYGSAFEVICRNLFPMGHPYSWLPIGSHEDLEAATLADVEEFFRTYYTPNNLTMVVAGDFEEGEALELVERYHGPIEPGPALERPKRWEVRLAGERRVVLEERVPQERISVVWPTVSYFEEGDADLDLVASILGEGLSSRLQRLLVYERQLCTSVSVFHWSLEIAGMMVVTATVRPGQGRDQVEAVILSEIRRLAQEGPSEEELVRSQNRNEYSFVTGLERMGGFGGRSDQLARYNTLLGSPDRFEADLVRYRTRTVETVRAAAARYLETPGRLIVEYAMSTPSRTSVSELDRSAPPGVAQDRPFVVPRIESGRLSCGMDVLVVPRSELPKVSVRLVAHGGSGNDVSGGEGRAALTMRVLDRGTGSLSALQIVDRLADLGARMECHSGVEISGVSLEILRRHLDDGLDLLGEVVREASFPEEELERERARLLDGLLQEEQDPVRLARRIAPMVMFGRNHPYGQPGAGTADTLPRIGVEDLRVHHEQVFRGGNMALILVGDISLEKALAAGERLFEGWREGTGDRGTVPEPRGMPPGVLYLVDHPGAAQSVVTLMVPGIGRHSESYFSLKLANAVLGGGFGTRLNMNLREDKGYTYGAHSMAASLSSAGWWRAWTSVKTDVTAASVHEMVSEMLGLGGERPITAKELSEAKENRIRGYAQSFETNSQIAGRLGELWGYGLPMSHLGEEPRLLSEVDLKEVRKVSKAYAQRDQLRLLVVGDKEKVLPGLRDLDLGDVVLLGRDGARVAP